jgi:enolase
MASITALQAREILDSRGVPTVECTIWIDSGQQFVTSVPSGTSIGKYEAIELRDKDPSRMLGQGVLQAVNNVNTIIAPQLIGRDPTQQLEIDGLLISLDGTPNKAKLGVNAVLAASQAVLKAGAAASGMPVYYYLQQKYQLTQTLNIPTCIYTLINGGQHGADNLDIQEFQIVPASFHDFPSSLNMASVLFRRLEEVLIAKGAVHSVGLVGGFAPNLYNNTDAFEILVETVKTSPYTFAQDLFFGVDVAAAELFEAGKYHLKDKSQPYSSSEMIEYYKNMRNVYKAFCIEDPFDDDDIKSWQSLTADIGETTLIAADSLVATNKLKIEKAIAEKWCNAILIKPNQAGTISETVEVVQMSQAAGWNVIMSHRSGETDDDLIADLAVGLGAEYTKFGPPNREERVGKYNRLLAIHTEIEAMNQTQQTQAAAAPAAVTPELAPTDQQQPAT